MSVAVNRLGLFALVATILGASPAAAQTSGSRLPTGSNLTGGLGFGNSGFGSSGAGGLGTGSFGSGLGQGGFGQGGLGQGGFGGGLGIQTSFGQSDSGFIGRDSGDVTAMFESMTRQGEQFMNRIERSINRSRQGDSGERTQQQVRVQLKVGFDYPDPATSAMATRFTNRLATVLANRKVAGASIERDGGNVIVYGTAADEWERMVVEQLIAQQPGVTSVTNQMTLGEAIDAPTPQE